MSTAQFSFLGLFFMLGCLAVSLVRGNATLWLTIFQRQLALTVFGGVAIITIAFALLGYESAMGVTFFALGFLVLVSDLDF